MSDNIYYEVVESVYYFDRMGHSPSNSWIGRSQVLDSIFVGRNAYDQDEFHLLVGGDFLVRESGPVSDVRFWLPKPVFEKSYGGHNTSRALFAELEKSGEVVRIPAPKQKIDYAGSRKHKEFPETHPRLVREEPSHTLVHLREQAEGVSKLAKQLGLHANFYDFDEERRALLQVVKSEAGIRRVVIEFKATETGRLYVKPSENFFDIPSFMEKARDVPGIDQNRIYESSFWAQHLDLFNDDRFMTEIDERLEAAANGTNLASTPTPRR
jgi:Holliday junction resolvase